MNNICGLTQLRGVLLGFVFLAGANFFHCPAQNPTATEAVRKTEVLVSEIARNSFPEINRSKIRVKYFSSDSVFFKTRFSLIRYLTFQRMRHLVFVNPKVFSLGTPESGIRAILAHELAHAAYYTRKNRLELLGLSSLASKGFTTKFERKADLEAVARGYGEGLIKYRKWLYANIPISKLAQKKRDYFSPEELKVMLEILLRKPSVIKVWRKDIPKNIEEIRKNA